MRQIILFLTISFSAFGQATVTCISPDDAAKHITKKVTPDYPSLARDTRITGSVFLQIDIDQAGTPSVVRLISGHPLLIQAAVDAVRKWKYRPFDVDGKLAMVNTIVMVPFGSYTSDQTAGVHAHMLFLAGQLCMAQKNYEEAERYYEQALKLWHNPDDEDAPEAAESLGNLAKLYAQDKKYDLARDDATRSIAICQKNFKKAGSGNNALQQMYGRPIAYQSWMLSKLALQQGDSVEAGKQCRTVLDFQAFLTPTDQNSFVPACQQIISSAGSRN
jgi:TonB family protein